MATLAQIEANRRNSQKSTGPRTASGKLTTSQNALKTGIYAEAEVIPGETAADLDSLSADYYTRFNPTTPDERFHIDILVHSDWMLRRFRRAEAQMWERSIEQSQSSYNPDEYHLGRAFEHESRDFGRLQRRIDATQRNYRDALKQLKQIQSDKPQPVADPLPAPKPPQSEIGFVPSPEPEAQPADPSTSIAVHTAPRIGFVPSPRPARVASPRDPSAKLDVSPL